MKKNLYCTAPQVVLRYLLPILVSGGILLPRQSDGQAINSCNLLANASFEQQNVAQPSGNANNIAGSNSQYDEVTGWKATGSFTGGDPTYGKPTYYATNAPTGSATNPLTNPATNAAGSSFQPYNYNSSLNNGSLSIITGERGTSSPLNILQYVTPTSSLSLVAGATYYGSFQAYRSSAPNSASPLGMQLSQSAPPTSGFPVFTANSTSYQSAGRLADFAWTRVSGKITIPSNATPDPWYAVIGNLSPNGSSGRARYYIDEVELYKIPTAGPSATCSGGYNVTIGEGCHIPGAIYEWRRNGSPDVISTSTTSPTTAVNITDTYTLKVTLPDQSTFSSQVSVTGCNAQPTISGPSYVCAGQSATYTANNGSVIWQAGPATIFSTANGYGQSFAAGVRADASGQGSVSATFYNLTGHPVLTKTVIVATADNILIAPDAIQGEYNVPPRRIRVSVDPTKTPQATSYNWYVNGTLNSEHGTTITFDIRYLNSCDDPELVEVEAVYGDCGVSHKIERYFYPLNCPSAQDSPAGARSSEARSSAYPNPATESLTIPANVTSATLLDGRGKPVRSGKGLDKLDVQSLPEGLYNLQMRRNGKLVNQRIQVKH